MKYSNFGLLTQEQRLAVVLGAEYEAKIGDEWIPGWRAIAGHKTEFRIAPGDANLETEATEILNSRPWNCT